MKPKMEFNTVSLAVIGVDIGKEVFHIVGLGVDGKIAFRRKIKRLGLADAFEKLPPSIVGMEACLSAHFVSRTLRALGHEPRIIPALYVAGDPVLSDASVRFVVEVPATVVSALIFSFRYLRFDQRDDLRAILAALDRLGRKPSITRIG